MIDLVKPVALLAALLCSVPAAAAGTRDLDAGPVEARVPYADLDLRTKQGASELDRRVRRAAMGLCAPVGTFELAPIRNACFRDAYESAKPAVRVLLSAASEHRPIRTGALVLKLER